MNDQTDTASPYNAPQADLETFDSSNEITNFKRFSAWGVFGLSVVTLGIYTIYWLYTRCSRLNEFYGDKIHTGTLVALPILFIISTALQIASAAMPEMTLLVMAVGIINIVYIVVFYILAYKLRNRIGVMTNDKPGPILTFFFSVIYLQYRINKAIDAVDGK